jgi:hypothetical protein
VWTVGLDGQNGQSGELEERFNETCCDGQRSLSGVAMLIKPRPEIPVQRVATGME